MWNWYYLFILLVYIASCNVRSTNGYDTPGGPQYHIQTDEGPERYFRYQTLSGQYRKEKRLQDGTVIGTYAWIDDDGIFRQRDYVADTGGYRIVKTKNIMVGRDMPIAEALKAAKKYPSSNDVVQITKLEPVSVRLQTNIQRNSHIVPSPVPVPTSSLAPIVEISNNALPTSTPLPILTSTPVSFVSSTERPFVEITPHSISSSSASYSSTVTPQIDTSSTPKPFIITPADTRLNNFLIPSSTPKSVVVTPAHTQLPSGVKYVPSLSTYENIPTYTEPSQNLDFNPYVSPINKGYLFHNGPTYPIDRNGNTYRGTRYSNDRIDNGYNKQYAEYDGVSVTNDGFRYYIPRAYHEEAQLPGNEKSGSFGYIDPFGIRRVIYYNAKPGSGFQHRKNNRYVGFDATPYDPRPY